MNLYFALFLAPIWPIFFPVFTLYCVKEWSNRPPFAYFLLMQHLSIFSGTRLKKREDEQHLAERSANETSKATKKASHGSPGESNTRDRAKHEDLTNLNRPPHGTAWPCHVAGSTSRSWAFSRILARWPHAVWHDRATPHSAKRLKFPFGLFWTTFSFMLSFTFSFLSEGSLDDF